MGERRNFFRNLFDSSEMACSLRFESVRGCPYGAFTPCGISMLSFASSLCAAVALVAGM